MIGEIVGLNGWSSLDFDDDDIKKTQDNQQELCLAIASKYHQVFKQNSIGREILNEMIKVTIMRATVHPNDSQFAVGIREGRADMVRQILQQIEIAERN